MKKLTKKTARNFENLCNFALAYMDLHNIRKPGTERLANSIIQEIRDL